MLANLFTELEESRARSGISYPPESGYSFFCSLGFDVALKCQVCDQ